MITRYCFIKLRDEHSPQRDVIARQAKQDLHAATEGAASLRVALPADDSASRWDIAIEFDCPDLATWNHLSQRSDFITAFAQLSTVALVIKQWNFEQL